LFIKIILSVLLGFQHKQPMIRPDDDDDDGGGGDERICRARHK